VRSPLHPVFAAAGACFSDRHGFEIPVEFSGTRAEYEAAAGAVVLAERSYRGRIRVTGKDRISFLQNMLSNDVKGLATGSGLYACWLSRQGKLISDLVVYRFEDSVLLEMEPERLTPVMESLTRYIVSEDVSLRDASPEEALVSLEGPRAAELLSGLTNEPLPPLAPFQFLERELLGAGVRVSAVAHGPGPGLDLALPSAEAPRLVETILERGRPLGLLPAGARALDIRRIEAGIPLFGVDMDESHMPLEAGLEFALSFQKGCYIGQEYVARLAHRGHVNKKLAGLRLTGELVPEPGTPIGAGDREIGAITSAAFSPTLGSPLALGYLQRDWTEPGTEVLVRAAAGAIAARVAALPFLPQP
jgi:aminomethyltransferase